MAAEWTLSVSQLNEYVRKSLGGDPMLQGIRVTGEISGFKRHFSGHLYFALKDESARVNCVMFRSAAASLGFVPEDGMRVIVTGFAVRADGRVPAVRGQHGPAGRGRAVRAL